MNYQVLLKIVNDCATKNMTVGELQLGVLQIANYLREGSVIWKHKNDNDNQNNQNIKKEDDKQYLKKQVKMVQQYITKKFDIVNNKFNQVKQMIIQVNQKQQKINSAKFVKVQEMQRIFETQKQTNIQVNQKLNDLNFRIHQLQNYSQQQIKRIISQTQNYQYANDQKIVKQKLEITQNLNTSLLKISTNLYELNTYTAKQKHKNLQKQIFIQNISSYKQQKYWNKFIFDGLQLSKQLTKSIGTFYDQFVFLHPIKHQNLQTFFIRIIKSKQKQIRIGVVDYQKQKQINDLINSPNILCYNASNGKKYPNEEYQGNGINVGETVEVIVDRNNKTIKWMVNGIQRACLSHDMLGDEKINLFPFVIMLDNQDLIEFIKY